MDKVSREFVLNILNTAKDLSIATNRPDGYPQVTTTSFIHDGLTIYIAIGPASQKARNITRDPKVSLVVDVPYSSWNDIRGISMAAEAHLVEDDAERQKAGELMTERFGALMREMPQSDVTTAMMEATFSATLS